MKYQWTTHNHSSLPSTNNPISEPSPYTLTFLALACKTQPELSLLRTKYIQYFESLIHGGNNSVFIRHHETRSLFHFLCIVRVNSRELGQTWQGATGMGYDKSKCEGAPPERYQSLFSILWRFRPMKKQAPSLMKPWQGTQRTFKASERESVLRSNTHQCQSWLAQNQVLISSMRGYA